MNTFDKLETNNIQNNRFIKNDRDVIIIESSNTYTCCKYLYLIFITILALFSTVVCIYIYSSPYNYCSSYAIRMCEDTCINTMEYYDVDFFIDINDLCNELCNF